MLRTARRFISAAYLWNSKSKAPGEFARVTLPDQSPIAHLSTSDGHSLLLSSTGQLYAMGDNSDGQLGLGDKAKRDDPTPVAALRGKRVVECQAGPRHSFALTAEGRLYSWGKGTHADALRKYIISNCLALGHSPPKNYWLPKQIDAFAFEKDDKRKTDQISPKIAQICTGSSSAMALDAEGQVWNWGRHEYGVSGMGNTKHEVPTHNFVIDSLCEQRGVRVKKIDACSRYAGILLENNEVFLFGSNDHGVIGIGEPGGWDPIEAINVPSSPKTEDGQPLKFVNFSLGEFTAVFLDEKGDFYITGQKKFHNPYKLSFDLKGAKVKDFCACDRGVAVLTEDNRIFTIGNFFVDKKPFNLNLLKDGAREIDVANVFKGAKVMKIGGKYEKRFAIVDE